MIKEEKDYGNSGVGTPQQMQDDIQRYTTDPVYLQAAIDRARQVIANRQEAGMDTSPQQLYLNKLLSTQANMQGGNAPVQNIQANNQLAGLEEMAKYYSDAYFQNQKAILEESVAEQLAELQRVYEEAIAEGKISIREAEEQFKKNKAEIEKLAYQDAEKTKLYGQEMGIQNSQQMLGIMAGDNARKNSLINQIMSDRDRRINDIRDRINAITKQKNLDIARVNQQFNAALSRARSEADMLFSDRMFGLQADDYRMNREHQLRKDEMQYAHTLDLEKMKVGHKLDLEKLAKQFDYDVAMENMRYGHESSLISQRAAAQAAAAKQEMLMKIQAEEIQYQKELERALAKFDENSKEGQLFKKELEIERDERVRQIIEDSFVKATVKDIYENPYLPINLGRTVEKQYITSFWPWDALRYGTIRENPEYILQQEAIKRRKELEDKYGLKL